MVLESVLDSFVYKWLTSFPSCCCWVTSVVSDSVWPHRRQPTRLPGPWDSPSKNTGVGCHFLLQCMKVKSESEVAQSCPTLSNPMDCRLPGSSIHGIFRARVLEWGAIAFSELALGPEWTIKKQIASGKLLYNTRSPAQCSVMTYRMGRRLKREGIYVYLWLIHIVLWQKPTQHCKAINIQWKINLKIIILQGQQQQKNTCTS